MKLTLKLALVPSVLALSLALVACQDASSPADNEGLGSTNSDTTIAGANSNAVTNTDLITDESAEQQMIDNLARYRWTLATATDNNSQPLTSLMEIKDQVMLSFNQHQGQNTLSYSVGCNTMNAAYQLQGQALSTEDSMSTKISCGDLDVAENRLNKLMQGKSELNLVEGEQPMLTQVTSDSVTLAWRGRLTAQAKYNSKGETIFWAVNAKKVSCADSSAQMCLQVKPITYNDQGLKTSEGDWAPFIGEIDGYQHDGAHDEVIRLQRYTLNTEDISDDNPSDEKYAYVLDAVIESAVVE